MLEPGGQAATASETGWKLQPPKPRPAAMGQWTQDRHDQTNNAIGTDTLAGARTGLRWWAGLSSRWMTGGGNWRQLVSKDASIEMDQVALTLTCRNPCSGLVRWSIPLNPVSAGERSAATVIMGDRLVTLRQPRCRACREKSGVGQASGLSQPKAQSQPRGDNQTAP